MYRAFPLLCLITFMLPVAAQDRFPPVQTTVMSSQNSSRAAYRYDSGDMNARTNGNDLQISWKAADGTPKTWVMVPDDFQNQVKCQEDKCALSSFPCYGKCIMSSPEIHLYDARDKKIYFSVALDISSNRPYAVFIGDLHSRKTTFLFEAYGSGLIRFVLSPSGSLLAFLAGSHLSACASSLHPQIFDIRKKILLEPAAKRTDESVSLRKNVSYESITWLSNSQLLLKGRMWNCMNVEAIDEVPIEAIVNLDDSPVQQ